MINDTAFKSSPAAVTSPSASVSVVQIIKGPDVYPGSRAAPTRSDAAALADHHVRRGGGPARLRASSSCQLGQLLNTGIKSSGVPQPSRVTAHGLLQCRHH